MSTVIEQEPVETTPLLVRVDDAAKLLSLSRSVVYELVAQGKIESVVGGKSRRVIVASLHTFIAQHRVQ